MGRPRTLSPKRREWLQRLADAGGPLRCDYIGTVGYGCRILGWTDWAYIAPDGKLLPRGEVEEIVGSKAYREIEAAGYRSDPLSREFITAKGLFVLRGDPQ